MAKTAKKLLTRVVECGSYKDHKNIAIYGNSMKTQWSFCISLSAILLELTDCWITRTNSTFFSEDRQVHSGESYPTESEYISEAKFLCQYWNMHISIDRIRHHMEFGSYHASMNITPTNYVLNLMHKLMPPLEGSDLVYKLACHCL